MGGRNKRAVQWHQTASVVRQHLFMIMHGGLELSCKQQGGHFRRILEALNDTKGDVNAAMGHGSDRALHALF